MFWVGRGGIGIMCVARSIAGWKDGFLWVGRAGVL